MKSQSLRLFMNAALLSVILGVSTAAATVQPTSSYADLVALFADWREFESPPLLDGAPDYSRETFAARDAGY